MTEKRIKWEKSKVEDNKYAALNEKLDILGYLEYENVGAHMHWCWYQHENIRMSPGCLQEVRDKQKELLKEKNGK